MTEATTGVIGVVSPFGSWVRETVRVGAHNRAHWVALRAALSMGVPLVIAWQLGHLDWVLFLAFGAFSSVFGRHQGYRDRARMQLGSGATIVATITLGTAVGAVAAGSLLAVAAMTVSSGIGLLLSRKNGWLPLGSLFFVFASGATSSIAQPVSNIPVAFVLCALAVLFSVGLGQLGRFTPAGRAGTKTPGPPVLTWRALLGAPGVRADAIRFAAGPLVAGGIATLVGIGHPYWAAVSATVPLVGVTLGAQLTRATHRFVGTLIGVAVALLILEANPSDGVMLAIVVVLQAFAELFVLRNYGLTVIGLTPLALLLSHLASPVPVAQLAGDRALETTIGVLVAVGIVLVTRLAHRRRPVAAGPAA
ncbi:FUSC family protein [Frondihabitans sucicola]|uniref:FUSC family protein n=1 Tax=Frondihabitans sucicola TaxID=1268041 RepID=A0ABM8GHE7_9MICO|nr:FUSC family protein [Frondihabitans sucicola]BDZ47800.1 FUSC family protein [Frondihabitans sucicola]BDZ52273.1 FUSC family protein [Frondihabitans sucicola]